MSKFFCFLAVTPFVSGLMLLAATCPTCAGQTLSYADLVHRMTDLSHLAVLPAVGEKCAQWSSYSRRSEYDGKTGKYVAWDANADGAGFIRKEGDQIVMAEMQGPGCIWRIWSARAKKGHVKIYLDGQETPAVDLPFAKFFSGDTAPFNYPELSHDLKTIGSKGQNLYFPISYQKSCKIVADEGWGQYYQVTYTTFPKETNVPTFNAALVAENAGALEKVNAFFKERLGSDPAGKRPGQESLRKTVALEPGTKIRTAELVGPRAITAIKVKTTFANRRDQMSALRNVALQITWDGEAEPAVWCPLGDFFGTAPGENLYKSLVTGMTSDGYYAYWYMPFGKSAVVELINDGKVSRSLEIEILHAPLERPFKGLGHFHAKWHRQTPGLSRDRWPDWVMLRTLGRGRFCGVMLHVWNPRGGWWGEGDEKFFVDGEKLPSIFGTGTEDYFGYAWCHPSLFQRPFHCQTMTEDNKGNQSVLRWQIADNVPFQSSFEGCIERYYSKLTTDYACTSCWYLSPEGSDPYRPVPVVDRDNYFTASTVIVAGMEIIRPFDGSRVFDKTMDSTWRNADQVRWEALKPGAKIRFSLSVKSAGKYRIDLGLMKAPFSPIVQFYLDGKKIGEPIDLYNSEPVLIPIRFSFRSLSASSIWPQKKHILTVECVNNNPNVVKFKNGLHAGFDYIDVTPVD